MNAADLLAGAVVDIVDDDPSMRAALDSLLRSAGGRPRCFASAEEFLCGRVPARTACLLLDIALPGMNGLELQRHLAASGDAVPVVFVTAQDDPQGRLARQAFDAGAVAFVRKPFGGDEVLRATRRALAKPWRARASA